MEDKYVVRKMTRSEVDFAVDLATQEGWNPGKYDADCFYAADPDGFLIGLLDGEPISSLSVVKYGDTYGFLGLYIVKKEYRDMGYGLRIWNEGMKYLQGRDIGLDGVLEQEGNYALSGFQLAYHNTRYKGLGIGTKNSTPDPRIVELSTIPLDELLKYDDGLFPASRPEFLKAWVAQPESFGLGIIDNKTLAGYSVLRKCHDGYKIGPLFAENEDLAETLFCNLCNLISQDTPVFLDVPGEKENPAATALAKRHGMKRVFETARMYRMGIANAEMDLPLDKWFGVTTFELG
jgi:hypothetical protein